MLAPPSFFIQNRLFFTVLLAVVFTIAFSFFNLNSIVLLVLLGCRLFLFEDPRRALRTAFANPVFLSFFIFCLLETAGLLHTHNTHAQFNAISKDATLTAMAFIFCAGRFSDEVLGRRLVTAYVLIVVAACLYCLLASVPVYLSQRHLSVFFYHALTRPIKQNAVFFSVYVVFALQFLLSTGEKRQTELGVPGWKNTLRIGLILFLLGMVVLLASKLLLVISLLLIIASFFSKNGQKIRPSIRLAAAAAILVTIGLMAFTNNPIKRRYQEMSGNLSVIHQRKVGPDAYLNAIQLRALEFRFAREILDEHDGWIFGVSPGDSQDYLNQKYINANMYVGTPESIKNHDHGFIGYNFHNQFLETLVRSGIIGLLSLISIFVVVILAARKAGLIEAGYAAAIVAIFFIPEAPLTMQQGVFLFCFFPLVTLMPAGWKPPAVDKKAISPHETKGKQGNFTLPEQDGQ